MDLLLLLKIGTGLFWSIVYLLIIKQGFKDKTIGMPMPALCANISWEFVFSFIFPQKDLHGIIIKIWLTLDIIILLQYLMFGRQEFKKTIPEKFFYPVFLLTIILSFLVIKTTIIEFGDFDGRYTAFASNLLMSVLFISLLLKRSNSRGQSLYIAIFKMIGSLLPAIAAYLYFRSNLITILSFGNLLFDLTYIILLSKYLTNKNDHKVITSLDVN